MNKEQQKKKGFDFSITPFRLAVVIIGLTLAGLNEFVSWNIPLLGYIVPIAIVLSVVLTQPRKNNVYMNQNT
jgi:hypothetical protein